jgi:hypothetical protein
MRENGNGFKKIRCEYADWIRLAQNKAVESFGASEKEADH